MMLEICPPGTLTKENVVGAILAIPASFFTHVEGSTPDCWGYVASVGQKLRRTDKPAYSLKFHDGNTQFYLAPHPNYTEAEKAAGINERYLTHASVKVLRLGPGS